MPDDGERVTDGIVGHEDQEDEEERRRAAWLPWITLLVVLLLVAWLIWRYAGLGSAPDVDDARVRVTQVTVPDVVGLRNRQAVKVLTAAGLQVERETSLDVVAAPDTVVSQDPGEGSRVAAGSTVLITVSVRPDLVLRAEGEADDALRVPSVVGDTLAEALALLEADGFAVSVSEVYSGSVPAGSVVDQTPAGGTAAKRGDTVGILVSKGRTRPASIRVPDVDGLTRDEAMRRIRASGLEPRVMYQPMQSSVGRVYQQSPSPGTMVTADRYVFILVGARP